MSENGLPEGWTKVEHWMGRLSPDNRRKNVYVIRKWMGWVRENGGRFRDYTPDDLIRFQAEASNGERFSILDETVEPFIIQEPGRIGHKVKLYSSIRSLFLHNRAELPKDASFKIKPTVPKVAGTLTPEEIRDIVLSCKPMYKAVYLCMFQAGMDEETFTWWSANGWGELRPQLEAGKNIIKITLPGRKSRKFEENYTTLIGDDAISALRYYVENQRGTGIGPIFPNRDGGTLSKNALYLYWIRQLRRRGLVGAPVSGVKNYRSGKNPHELRDVFRTLWAMSGAAPHIGEAMMGHTTDELGYDKSPKNERYVLEQYRKALRFLNLMSSLRAFGQVSEDEVESLRRQLREAQAGQNGKVAELQQQRAEDREEMLSQKEVIAELVKTVKELKSQSQTSS